MKGLTLFSIFVSLFDFKFLMNRFCYMKPFEQCCEIPEQKVASGVITVSAKRSGYEYIVSNTSERVCNTSEGEFFKFLYH